MRRIVVDIGNSKLAAALADGGRLRERFTRPYGRDGQTGRERAVAALGDWCVEQLRDGGLKAVGCSSVAPIVGKLWAELWRGRELTREIPFVQIDHRSPLPYTLSIDEPHSVGADRLCNVAAAARRGLKNAIVMDLGTANTYDVLSNGVFIGGLIAAGTVSAHGALIERGAQLPDLPFEKPQALVGRRTAEAMQSGSFHQGIGGIYYVLHRLQRAHSGFLTLATGGIAQLLADELPPDVLLVPDLTLEGVLAILDATQESD